MDSTTETTQNEWTTVGRKQHKLKQAMTTGPKPVESKPVETKQAEEKSKLNVYSKNKHQSNDVKQKEQVKKVPTEWEISKYLVSDSYLKYITSKYSDTDIKNKISSAMYMIDRQTGSPTTYVFLDIRKWSNSPEGEEIEFEEVNDFKFVYNRFFEDIEFVKKLKEHFRELGHNIGFQKRKVDNHYKVFGIKCYFRS